MKRYSDKQRLDWLSENPGGFDNYEGLIFYRTEKENFMPIGRMGITIREAIDAAIRESEK